MADNTQSVKEESEGPYGEETQNTKEDEEELRASVKRTHAEYTEEEGKGDSDSSSPVKKYKSEEATKEEPAVVEQHTLVESHVPYDESAAYAASSLSYSSYPQDYGLQSSTPIYSQPQPQLPLPESMSSDPPSKVIHFRNVTAEITQEDVMELSTPFGQVEKVVMMRTKNQCLIEFKELAHAIMMSNFYVNTQPQVRGRKIYMRFSRHQALTGTNCNINKVLLVTLQTDQEPVIPITADIVWQIFSTYGFIEKIVVINKNGGLQALVQYSNPLSGSTAMQYLNAKTVYVGTDPILSITLYIQYSHLPQLTVRQNTAQARDYTTPLPWGQSYYGYGSGGGGGGGGYEGQQQLTDYSVPQQQQHQSQQQHQPQQQQQSTSTTTTSAPPGSGSITSQLYAMARYN